MTKDEILTFLKNNKKTFQKKYNIEQIGLYGSYARNEATSNSDIDIFVKMPPKFFDILSVKEDLEKAFNKNVDIVRIRDKMNPFLQKRILKDGIDAI